MTETSRLQSVRTCNVNVLDDVEHVVFVDLPLLLRLQDVINGALEPVVVHGLGARQLPAETPTGHPCEHIIWFLVRVARCLSIKKGSCSFWTDPIQQK